MTTPFFVFGDSMCPEGTVHLRPGRAVLLLRRFFAVLVLVFLIFQTQARFTGTPSMWLLMNLSKAALDTLANTNRDRAYPMSA